MGFLLQVFAEGEAVGEQAAQPGALDYLVSFMPMILVFVVMYLILILPQRKKEKKTRQMINSAVVGDRVVSIGGISGKVVNIKDDEFTIESGIERSKINVKKWAIKEVVKPMES